jgi:hypothetical protein
VWNLPIVSPGSWLSRDNLRKIAYHKIEIFNGFCALTPRFAGRHAILTYSREGKKVFRYYIGVYALQELFVALDSFCSNTDGESYEEYFMTNHLELYFERVLDIVTINVSFSTHKVAIMGLVSQLESAIAQYHHLNRGISKDLETRIKLFLTRSKSLPDQNVKH